VYFLLSSIVYTEDHPRHSLVPGLALVSLCHPPPFNFLRIRTSKTRFPQPLYNPHLHSPLGCAGNKGLRGARIHRQLSCNQHLRTSLGSAENKGFIILLESALTKNASATPLESALPKNKGGTASFACGACPDPVGAPGGEGDRNLKQRSGKIPLSTLHVQKVPTFDAQCALPLRPVILGGRPMKRPHHDCDAAIPSSPLPACGCRTKVSRITSLPRARRGGRGHASQSMSHV
jgi:hypothetical protein